MPMQSKAISKEDLAVRIVALLQTLKPFETVEIKLHDNLPGEIAILVKSNHREVVSIED